MPRSALLLGTVVVGAALLAPPLPTGGLGLASAQAAPSQQARKKGKARSAKVAKPTAKARAGGRRVKFVERSGLARARYAALPRFTPKVVLRPAPTVAPAASVAVAPAPAEAAAQVTAPVQSAVPSPLDTLPPERVIATASISPAPMVHPGAERMRPALEARARSLASEIGLGTLPLPEAAPSPQLSARRVTFDLDRGERTIVFEDGAAVTAPFDKAKASDMTGLKPVSP